MIIDTVLTHIYNQPQHVKGTFGRDIYPIECAALASLGFISTQTTRHNYGKVWRITKAGLQHLKEQALL